MRDKALPRGGQILLPYDCLPLPSQPILRVVITGGPCSGKTTGMRYFKKELEQLGYVVFGLPEVATMLMEGGARLWLTEEECVAEQQWLHTVEQKKRLHQEYLNACHADQLPDVNKRKRKREAKYFSSRNRSDMLLKLEEEGIGMREARTSAGVIRKGKKQQKISQKMPTKKLFLKRGRGCIHTSSSSSKSKSDLGVGTEDEEGHFFDSFHAPHCVSAFPSSSCSRAFCEGERDGGGGHPRPSLLKKLLQRRVLQNMLAHEDTFYEFALSLHQPVIILIDRGSLDGAAYCTHQEWDRILLDTSFTEEALVEGRYDAVIHFITAADGACEYYTLCNNHTRHESVEEAIEQDRRTRQAWRSFPFVLTIGNHGHASFDNKMISALDGLIKILHSFVSPPPRLLAMETGPPPGASSPAAPLRQQSLPAQRVGGSLLWSEAQKDEIIRALRHTGSIFFASSQVGERMIHTTTTASIPSPPTNTTATKDLGEERGADTDKDGSRPPVHSHKGSSCRSTTSVFCGTDSSRAAALARGGGGGVQRFMVVKEVDWSVLHHGTTGPHPWVTVKQITQFFVTGGGEQEGDERTGEMMRMEGEEMGIIRTGAGHAAGNTTELLTRIEGGVGVPSQPLYLRRTRVVGKRMPPIMNLRASSTSPPGMSAGDAEQEREEEEEEGESKNAECRESRTRDVVPRPPRSSVQAVPAAVPGNGETTTFYHTSPQTPEAFLRCLHAGSPALPLVAKNVFRFFHEDLHLQLMQITKGGWTEEEVIDRASRGEYVVIAGPTCLTPEMLPPWIVVAPESYQESWVSREIIM